MPPLVRRSVKRAKLVYLWVMRILVAPNRFKVPLTKRLYWAVKGGFIGDQIALYDLNKHNASEYLSEFDWYRSRWINEPFDSMLNNKIISNEVFEDLVRVPQTFYIKNKGRVYNPRTPERHSSLDDVLRELDEQGSYFLKPIGSGRGKGVHRIDATNSAYLLDRKPISREALMAFLLKNDEWFVSETIEQHPAIAALHPETTNTIRLITMRNPETGELGIFFAVMRVGTADTVPVDNGSRGGLVVNIDLDTGVLSDARTLWSKDEFTSHPNTGEAISGFTVPNWEAVKQEILAVAQKVPYLQFIAWDLLIGEKDVTVIEANTSSGVNIIQLWGPQRNNELGDFYRAHGVIK